MKSYAQNFEDVMLMRAFRGVMGGFYIDIGAADPITDSVTLAFYERGWRGIHVEPNAEFAQALRDARCGDIVVEALVGEGEGEGALYAFPGTGLSTTNAEYARMHAESGRAASERRVAWTPLSEIFDLAAGAEIHFLKIDVEGCEESVLRSWGDHPARPWALVVEATLPNSTEQNYASWEPEVLRRGYRFAWFDGVNRYYVHEAHSELDRAFGVPPNFFDAFDLAEHSPFVVGISSAKAALAAENAHLRAHAAAKEDEARSAIAAATAGAQAFQVALETVRAELAAARGLQEAVALENRQLSEMRAALSQERAAADALAQRLRAELAEEQSARRAVEAAADARALAAESARAAAEAQSLARHKAIEAMRTSFSWRISAPARWAGTCARGVKAPVKNALRLLLERALSDVRSRPGMKKAILALASLVPRAKAKLLRFAAARPYFLSDEIPDAEHTDEMSASVRSIVLMLKRELSRRGS